LNEQIEQKSGTRAEEKCKSLFVIRGEEQYKKHQRRHFKGGGEQNKKAEQKKTAFDEEIEAHPEHKLFKHIYVACSHIEKNSAVERQKAKEIKSRAGLGDKLLSPQQDKAD